MQIILLEKIANVGNLGDVVKVKDGYARNFLIPHGKAKRATPDNVKMLEAKRAELEAAANAKLAEAQAQAAKLEGLMVQITQKAGVDGRLFGSVTNADIVEALKGQGFAVERAAVRMPAGPLKQVGDHPLVVALHTDVTANITVGVLGDTSSGG
jgi:large subunit ribosomal protein L9